MDKISSFLLNRYSKPNIHLKTFWLKFLKIIITQRIYIEVCDPFWILYIFSVPAFSPFYPNIFFCMCIVMCTFRTFFYVVIVLQPLAFYTLFIYSSLNKRLLFKIWSKANVATISKNSRVFISTGCSCHTNSDVQNLPHFHYNMNASCLILPYMRKRRGQCVFQIEVTHIGFCGLHSIFNFCLLGDSWGK